MFCIPAYTLLEDYFLKKGYNSSWSIISQYKKAIAVPLESCYFSAEYCLEPCKVYWSVFCKLSPAVPGFFHFDKYLLEYTVADKQCLLELSSHQPPHTG